MRENALLNAFKIKQLAERNTKHGEINIVETWGKETGSEQVAKPSMKSTESRQLRRVPKSSSGISDSAQVNRVGAPQKALRSLPVSPANKDKAKHETTVVSWSTKLMSLRKTSGMTLCVKSNHEVEEDVVISWSAEIATQWSTYENMKGTIVIPAGKDSGLFEIKQDDISSLVDRLDETGLTAINYRKNKSKFEIETVDQIVFRLDEVQEGNAIIQRDGRRCNVSILDDSQYTEKINSLEVEIQNTKNRIGALNTIYGIGAFESNSLDDDINQIEKLIKAQLEEIQKWKTDESDGLNNESNFANQLLVSLDVSNNNYKQLADENEKLDGELLKQKERSSIMIDQLNEIITEKDNEIGQAKNTIENQKTQIINLQLELGDAWKNSSMTESVTDLKSDISAASDDLGLVSSPILKSSSQKMASSPRSNIKGSNNTQSRELRRVPKKPEPVAPEARRSSRDLGLGSVEINRTLKDPRSRIAALGAARGSSSDPIVVSWSSKLMSLYRKSELTLHVRSNLDVNETIVLIWSAEVATQWSRYEYLRGRIDIPAGCSSGQLRITDDNFSSFIDRRHSASRPINMHVKRSKFELAEIDQVIFRLEDIEHGDAIIKRDTRRCHVAIIDDTELTTTKTSLAAIHAELEQTHNKAELERRKSEETEKDLQSTLSDMEAQLRDLSTELAIAKSKTNFMIKLCLDQPNGLDINHEAANADINVQLDTMNNCVRTLLQFQITLQEERDAQMLLNGQLTSQNLELQSENSEVKINLNNSLRDLENAKLAIDRNTIVMENLESENTLMVEENNVLNETVDNLKAEMAKLKSELEAQLERETLLEKNMNKMTTDLEAKAKTVTDQNTYILELETKVLGMEEELLNLRLSLEANLQILGDKNSELNIELENLRAEMVLLNNMLAEISEEKSSLLAAYEKLSGTVDKLSIQMADKESELGEARETLGNQILELQSLLANRNQALDEMTRDLAVEKQQVVETHQLLVNEQSQVAALKSTLRDKLQFIENLEHELSNVRSDLAAKLSELDIDSNNLLSSLKVPDERVMLRADVPDGVEEDSFKRFGSIKLKIKVAMDVARELLEKAEEKVLYLSEENGNQLGVIKSLREENAALSEAVASYSQKIDLHIVVEKTLNDTISSGVEINQKLEFDKRALQDKIQKQTQDINKKDKQIESKNEMLESVKQTLAANEINLDKMEKELGEANIALDNVKRDLNAQLTNLQEICDGYSEREETLTGENTMLKTELSETHAKVLDGEAREKNLNEHLSTLKANIAIQESRMSDMDSWINKLYSMTTALNQGLHADHDVKDMESLYKLRTDYINKVKDMSVLNNDSKMISSISSEEVDSGTDMFIAEKYESHSKLTDIANHHDHAVNAYMMSLETNENFKHLLDNIIPSLNISLSQTFADNTNYFAGSHWNEKNVSKYHQQITEYIVYLNNEYTDITVTLKERDDSIEQLKFELDNNKSKLYESENAFMLEKEITGINVSELESAINQKSDKLLVAESAITDFENEVLNLRKSLTEATESLSAAVQENQNSNSIIDDQKDTIGVLKDEKSSLAGELEAKMLALDDLTRQLQMQMMVAQGLAEELDEVKSDAQNSEDDLKRRIEELEELLASAVERVANMSGQLDKTTEDARLLNEQLQVALVKHMADAETIKSHLDTIDNLRAEKLQLENKLETNLEIAASKQEDFERQLKLMQETHDGKSQDFQEKLVSLLANLDDLKSELTQEKSANNDLRQVETKLQTALAQIKSECDFEKLKNNELANRISELQGLVANANAELESVKLSSGDLSESNRGLSSELGNTKLELQRINDQIVKLQKELEDKEQEIKLLKSGSEEASKELFELGLKFKNADGELQKVLKELDEAKDMLKNSTEELKVNAEHYLQLSQLNEKMKYDHALTVHDLTTTIGAQSKNVQDLEAKVILLEKQKEDVIANLEHVKAELHSRIDELNDNLKILTNGNSLLTHKIDTIVPKDVPHLEKLEIISDELKNLQHNVDRFNAENKELKGELDRQYKESEDLRKEIADRQEHITSLEANYEKLKQDHDDIKAENENLMVLYTKTSDELAKANDQLGEKVNLLTDAKREILVKDAQVTTLEGIAEELQTKNDNFEKDIAELNTNVEEYLKMIERLSTDKDGLMVEKDAVDNTNRELNAQLAEKLKNIEDLEGKFKETRSEIENLTRELENRNIDNAEKNTIIDNLKSEMATHVNNYTLLINKINVIVVGDQTELDKLDLINGELAELRNSVAEYRAEIESLSQTAKHRNNEIEKLKLDNDNLNMSVEKLGENVAELSESIENYIKFIERLSTDKDNLLRENKELNNENEKIIAENRLELENLNNDLKTIRDQLEAANNSVESLNELIVEKDEKITSLQKASYELAEIHAESVREAGTLRLSLMNITEQNDNLDGIYKKLKKFSDEAASNYSGIQTENDRLKIELQLNLDNISGLNDEIIKLKAALEEQVATNGKLEEAIQENQEKIATYVLEIETLTSEINKAKYELQLLNMRLIEAGDSNEKLSITLKEERETVAAQIEEIGGLNNQIKNINQINTEIQTKLDDASTELEKRIQLIDEAKQNYKDLEENKNQIINDLGQRLKDAEAKIVEQAAAADGMLKMIENMSTTLDEKIQMISNLEKKIAHEELMNTKSRNKLKNKINELEIKYKASVDELGIVEKAKASSEAALEIANNRVISMEGSHLVQVQRARQVLVGNLKTTRNGRALSMEDLVDLTDDLTNELEKVKAENEEKTRQIEDSHSTLSQQEQDLENLKLDIRNLELEIGRLTILLANSNAEKEDFKTEVNRQGRQLAVRADELETEKIENLKLSSRVSDLEEEGVSQARTIQIQTEKISNLEGGLSAKKEIISNLEKEIENLRKIHADAITQLELSATLIKNLNMEIGRLQGLHEVLSAEIESGKNLENENQKELKLLREELMEVKQQLGDIELLCDDQLTDSGDSALPRLKEVYKFVSDIMLEKKLRDAKVYGDKECQTEIGAINSTDGEIGFEHQDHEVPYEAKLVVIPMKRIKGSEGRASCFWRCTVEDGDIKLLCQSEGYINFEDGEVYSELEIDFEPYVLTKVMRFRIEVIECRGCQLSSHLHSTIMVSVNPPEEIPAGLGFIEFVKDKYEVEPNQSKARVLLRRRGSFGRIKKAEIFTRDLSAEEGRDYYCSHNDLGLVTFGPAEVYKEIYIRISSKRGSSTRTFNVELGNNEGIHDMKRCYETKICIKPAKFSISFHSGEDSADEVDSIHSDFYESALEQIERNFCDFDASTIKVNETHNIDSMFFEKPSFFYWLDDGVVEVSVESSVKGKWRTMDNNISAKVGKHYNSGSGEIAPGYNMIEVQILKDEEAVNPVGFGIEVNTAEGELIQTTIILQPYEYNRQQNFESNVQQILE